LCIPYCIHAPQNVIHAVTIHIAQICGKNSLLLLTFQREEALLQNGKRNSGKVYYPQLGDLYNNWKLTFHLILEHVVQALEFYIENAGCETKAQSQVRL
jgi:hypothetical protein